MALTTTFPPQAYTRDTLVKALEWLSTQPPHFRERATTADLIVSCYMQAARKTAAHMEAPVSGENFRADLKALANDLKMFEEPIAPPQVALGSLEPLFKPEGAAAPTIAMPPPAPPTPTKPAAPTWPVDARSLELANEVCARFNLGSEQEALRMLVTMGAQKLKEVFP